MRYTFLSEKGDNIFISAIDINFPWFMGIPYLISANLLMFISEFTSRSMVRLYSLHCFIQSDNSMPCLMFQHYEQTSMMDQTFLSYFIRLLLTMPWFLALPQMKIFYYTINFEIFGDQYVKVFTIILETLLREIFSLIQQLFLYFISFHCRLFLVC